LHIVVLGHPEALESEAVGGLREIEGGCQRIGAGLVAADGNKIKYGQSHIEGQRRQTRNSSVHRRFRAADWIPSLSHPNPVRKISERQASVVVAWPSCGSGRCVRAVVRWKPAPTAARR